MIHLSKAMHDAFYKVMHDTFCQGNVRYIFHGKLMHDTFSMVMHDTFYQGGE